MSQSTQRLLLDAGSSAGLVHVWTPAIVARIAAHLPPNEVACVLRLVNKATSEQLSGQTLVRLSQPAPRESFASGWASPQAFRPLSRAKREQLLCLVATSGDVVNLGLVLAACGLVYSTGTYNTLPGRGYQAALEAAIGGGHLDCCRLQADGADISWHWVQDAAASSGQVEICRWCWQQCPSLLDRSGTEVLQRAARGGHRALCEEAIATFPPLTADPDYLVLAATAAARGGHQDLMAWLLSQRAPEDSELDTRDLRILIVAVAEGCDLPTLQRVCARYGAWPHGDDEDLCDAVLAGVTRSQSADWRAKVTWVFELGESLVPGDCYAAAAKRPAAVPSFEWLKSQHQLDPNPDDRAMMEGVAAAGDVAAAAWLLREGVRPFCGLHAVRHGQLEILKLLHAKPERYVIPVPYLALEEPRMLTGVAAKSAQLEIPRWLHETFGPAALDDTGTKGGDSPSYIFTPLTELAAWSGDVEVLEWLRERGCPLGECLWAAAADAGCEAMLERLDEWQVAKPASGTPFLTAARAGDAHTLRVLHRLGVPSGPTHIFTHAVAQAPLPALQLLLELSGTEVDWAAAEAARRLYLEERGMQDCRALQWILGQRRQHEASAAASAPV